MYGLNVILLLSTSCICHALFKKKELPPVVRAKDPEMEFQEFMKQSCFESLTGAVMDGNTKYLLTPAQNAYDCLDQCQKTGEKRNPPVCCKAANFLPNKPSMWEQQQKFPFLKRGTCECFFSISYATFAKEAAIWMKRTIDPKCIPVKEEHCPKPATMSAPMWPWPVKTTLPNKGGVQSTLRPPPMPTDDDWSRLFVRPPGPPGPPGSPG